MPDSQTDGVFGHRAGPWERFTSRMMLRLALRGIDVNPDREIPLTWHPSPHVDGLRLFTRGHGQADDAYVPPGEGLLVGTVRMGFGHHRIARSVYTWSQALGHTTWLHDLLAIESPEADSIRAMDATYSRYSRLSSNLGGPFEWLWGKLMQQGGPGSLRTSLMLAEAIAPLMKGIPRDIPVISSYPLNGQIAVALGFERVINLVIDNHPQYFTLVPGALNLVQGPAWHERFLAMGVPERHLRVAGHWVSEPLATHAVADSAARIARADAGHPRRLLVPVGGAGAQRKWLVAFLKGLAPRLREGSIRVFLNAGDHGHMKVALERTLAAMKVGWRSLSTLAEVRDFCNQVPLDGPEPSELEPVVLGAFDSHFEAFTTTDLLMRVSDVLVTKPSELAFFPIPKLHIRRVGNHEAASAMRAAELGEGTPECRKVAHALETARMLCEQRHPFVRMCRAVAAHAQQGIYDGSKHAVQRAMA